MTTMDTEHKPEQNKDLPWFEPDINPIPSVARELLEKYR